jgi:nicotinate phosphoribosyltransferase
MTEARFGDEEIGYLRSLEHPGGGRVFRDDFLDWLRRHGTFEGVSLRAVPEGRVVHPDVPITVAQGPLAMAQILETALLNHLNYQTLIATKAARIRQSGHEGTLIEFGLRRGQETGANAGARAALIGGADFTSNVALSRAVGLPPKGTHAHSMVQAFMALGGDELAAFRAYAEAYPDACLLLVDTVDTLNSGIPNAIKVFQELRKKGHEPMGIRLDSGDLAYLSVQAAKQLNAAGFDEAKIVLSNQLDEIVLWQIRTQIRDEAPRYSLDADALMRRLVYGVGTRLITSSGDPALDGVYKLVAVEDDGTWKPAIKISENVEKTLNPGNKGVWRLYDARGKAAADLLCVDGEDPRDMDPVVLRHPSQRQKSREVPAAEVSECDTLLVDVLREGRIVADPPSLEAIRERRKADLDRLDEGVKRLVNPHVYHVSLSQRLWDHKQELIAQAKGR